MSDLYASRFLYPQPCAEIGYTSFDTSELCHNGITDLDTMLLWTKSVSLQTMFVCLLNLSALDNTLDTSIFFRPKLAHRHIFVKLNFELENGPYRFIPPSQKCFKKEYYKWWFVRYFSQLCFKHLRQFLCFVSLENIFCLV